MGIAIEYRGYKIESAPQRVAAWGKWQLCIFIAVDDHHGIERKEFCSDVLYATEQTADAQGIAFAKRLIDGKVDGLSIAGLKAEDRRVTPRFPVQFRSTLCIAKTLEGGGNILDLSRGGCRLESPLLVAPDVPLALRIEIPDLVWPLRVETARVQWVNSQIFGLTFSRIAEGDRRRLDHVMDELQGAGVSQGIEP